jgi:hypothetical protein
MSQKIIVSVCVGFLVVATGTAGVLFLATAKTEQNRLAISTSAPIAGAALVGSQPPHHQNSATVTQSKTAISNPIAAAPATVGQANPGPPVQANMAKARQANLATQTLSREDVAIQTAPSPAPAPAVASTPAQAQRQGQALHHSVVASPKPQTQHPTVQVTLPTPPPTRPATAPALAPAVTAPVTQPPAIAPKPPQAVEAVVVTGQRTQHVARTDIDSIGRGNSLTIQLPKRRQ